MLKPGDTIKCFNSEEAVEYMLELEKNGIETDFLYEVNGVKGIYLEVVNVKKSDGEQE